MIRLQRDNDQWTAVIDRADKANSLTKPMLEELSGIARDARGKAKVLVLTGTGSVFSAGADLDAARSGLATDPIWETLSGALADLPCLTIAALNGTLAGGAFGMALACDVRIAVTDAKFFYPVMKLGFLPQPSDPKRLADLVGPARAKMILMCGQKVSASDARDWGLVDRIVTKDALQDATRELADAALAARTSHVGAIKALFG